MSIFKRGRKFGPMLLGVWLIASGLIPLLNVGIPYSGPVLGQLAIVAGVLILMER